MLWKKLFFILAAALLLAGCLHAGKAGAQEPTGSEDTLPGEETEQQEELLEQAIDEEALAEEGELPKEDLE